MTATAATADSPWGDLPAHEVDTAATHLRDGLAQVVERGRVVDADLVYRDGAWQVCQERHPC